MESAQSQVPAAPHADLSGAGRRLAPAHARCRHRVAGAVPRVPTLQPYECVALVTRRDGHARGRRSGVLRGGRRGVDGVGVRCRRDHDGRVVPRVVCDGRSSVLDGRG